jgi:hypothetical protein
MQERRTHGDQIEARRTPARSGPVQNHPMLGLQQRAGNAAVNRLLAVQRDPDDEDDPTYANLTGKAKEENEKRIAEELRPGREPFRATGHDDMARQRIPEIDQRRLIIFLSPEERADLATGKRQWENLKGLANQREKDASPTARWPIGELGQGKRFPGAYRSMMQLGGVLREAANPSAPVADHPALVPQPGQRNRSNAMLPPMMTTAAPPTAPLHTTGQAAANVLQDPKLFGTARDVKKALRDEDRE